MAVTISLQMSHDLGRCKNHGCNKQFRSLMGSGKLHLVKTSLPSLALRQDPLSIRLPKSVYSQKCRSPCKHITFRCHSVLNPGNGNGISCMKDAAVAFTRSCNAFQGSPIVLKLVSAVGIIAFALWGLGPLMRQSRIHKNGSGLKKSERGNYHVMTPLLPLLLWSGVIFICRELDPVVLPSEGIQVIKQRVLSFIISLSTLLTLAYYFSSFIQQAEKFFTRTNDSTDPRPLSSSGVTMSFQFLSRAVVPAVLVAAILLFLELLGISTPKLLTAGGLGTVLLTFAGREIFRNFLSSAIIHATRPFVVNDWVQTKIEGYDVSGNVERVGWWTPTIIRGENREAVHIPNHQFTVNVVSNLSQKTHWRVKTHLAISHVDFNKINNIVADMRKVLAKNPQVEHKKLHRRVFLDYINPDNQGLMIYVSCFVKTSHLEEYMCVKEAILLDLLKVISHHRVRLATPIRTVQKIYSDSDFEDMPFSDSPRVAYNRPLLLSEPSPKINGEDRTKTQTRSARTGGEKDSTSTAQHPPNANTDAKVPPQSKAKETSTSAPNVKNRPTPDSKIGLKAGEIQNLNTKEENTDRKVGDKAKAKSKQESDVPLIQQSKQENERPTQPPLSRPPLEENIVLGVALEGSKRTLPIEDDMVPAPTQAEVKELAKSRSGNGSSAAEKDKKDSQLPNVSSTTSSGDRRDQQN